MNKNPHVVFFYSPSCPHCIRTRPMWEAIKPEIEAEGLVPLEYSMDNVPPEAEARIEGVPRMERTSHTGAIVVVVEGAPRDVEDLRRKLKLKKRKSTRKGGRRALRRRRNTLRRKL